MPELKTYEFAKRHNSTKQPDSSDLVATEDFTAKGGDNIISPTFKLYKTGRPTFNYCHTYGRYYFVHEIECIRDNLWDIHCEEDYLASWKTAITNTTALILYANGGRSDIVDKRIPITKDVTITSELGSFSGLTINTIGTMPMPILGISGSGSCGAYVLQFSSALNELLDGVDAWGNSWTDALDALKQLAYGGGASQNLRYVIGLPISFGATDVGGTLENISLGSYPCKDSNGNAIQGYKINKYVLQYDATVSIPWTNSGWLRQSPYSRVYAYVPFFGLITFNASELENDSSLYFKMNINVTSGDCFLAIRGSSSNNWIYTGSTNIAVPVGWGSSGGSPQKAIAGSLAGAAAIAGGIASMVATGGATAPGVLAVGGGMSGIAGSLIASAETAPAGNGGACGGATYGLDNTIKVYCVSRSLSATPSSLENVMGKPVFAKHSIGDYSGYVQTDGASVAGKMFDSERQTINQMLDGGVYIE